MLRQAGRSPEEIARLPQAAGFRELLRAASRRLAVYGSLAPGREHREVLAGLPGVWCEGFVRGAVRRIASGPDRGYPALTRGAGAPEVEVLLFESDALRGAWERVDAFEGAGYRRELVPVRTANGATVIAFAYVRAGSVDPAAGANRASRGSPRRPRPG